MSLLPYWYDLNRRNRLFDIDRRLRWDDWDHFRDPMLRDPFFRDPMSWVSPALRDVGANIKCDKDKFQISVDVQHFTPEEIAVKTTNDGYVVIEGKHEERQDEHGYVSRQFSRRYKLPDGCLTDTVQSSLSSDGVLTVSAPLKLALPNDGERIVPITQTGPVHRKIASQPAEQN